MNTNQVPTTGPLSGIPTPVVLPRLDLAALARQQGVKPVDNPDCLTGDFWPADESIEDFLAQLRVSRREGSGAT